MTSTQLCLATGLVLALLLSLASADRTDPPAAEVGDGVLHHQPGAESRVISLLESFKERLRGNKSISVAMLRGEKVGRSELLSVLVYILRTEMQRDDAAATLHKQDTAEELYLFNLTVGTLAAWIGSLLTAITAVCCVLKKRNEVVRAMGEDLHDLDIAMANLRPR